MLGNDTEQVNMTTVLGSGRLDLEIMIRVLSLYIHTLHIEATLTKPDNWKVSVNEGLEQTAIFQN